MTIPKKRSWSNLSELNDRSVPPNQASKGLCMILCLWAIMDDMCFFTVWDVCVFGPPKTKPITNSELTLFQACIPRWWFQIYMTFTLFGQDFQFDYFSDGLKPPTRSKWSYWFSIPSTRIYKLHPARLRNKNKPGQMQAKNVVGGGVLPGEGMIIGSWQSDLTLNFVGFKV